MNKLFKKIILTIIIGIFVISFNTAIYATDNNSQTQFSDIEQHWAEPWIIKAVNLGFVTGYEDNTFRPDITVTRAEFAKLLNYAMNLENTYVINFTDVTDNNWYYKDVQKSVAAGYFNGYDDNTFRPNNPIKREEAATVISNSITKGSADGEGATLLHDYNSIQSWAKDSVNVTYNKGYILGYPDGFYMPSKALTRAEAVKIICEVIENENIERGFNLTNYNETYKEAVVVGSLNVMNSVGSGNVYINNVTVLGDINIYAENINSVVLTDVRAKNIIVHNTSNPVKIICYDNIYIHNIQLPIVASLQKLGTNIIIKDYKYINA